MFDAPEEYVNEHGQPCTADGTLLQAADEELFYEDAGVAEDGAVAEEMIVDEEAAVEEVVYAEEEVAVTEELVAEEQEVDEFFIDTGDAVAETEVGALQEEVAEEASFVEVAEEIAAEEFFEEAIAEEVVYEEVIEEAAVEEVAVEEQVEFVEEGVVYEEAAVVEEVAVAEEGDFFVMDTAGEEEVPAEEAVAEEEVAAEEMVVEAQEFAAEEAVVEEVFAEEVVEEEAAVEEVAAEELFYEEVVAAEGEEALVEDATAMEIVEEAPAEDAATMEIVEEAVAEEVVFEEVAEEGGEEQLMGNLVADSFSTSFDDDGTAEEPASKKQKLTGDLSLPIAKRTAPQEDEAILLDSPTGLESPVGDSAPNDLEDGLPPASPTSPSQKLFRAPSTKWSGAKPPPSLAGEKRASPEVSNVVSKAGVAKTMVMPATSKGGMPATSKGAPPKQAFKASAFKGGAFPSQAVAKPPFAAKWGGAAPGGTPGLAMSSSLNKAQGYVFVCNTQTMAEVAKRKLFGSPDRELAQMKQHIKSNTSLYLMNFDTLKIYGPFAPDGEPEQAIEKGAFGGRFNAQLRVKPTERFMEAQVEKRIPAGPKDPSGMRQINGCIDSGIPAAADVRGLWMAGGASVGGAMQPSSPPARTGMLVPSFNSPMVLPGSPINQGFNTPKQMGVALRGMVRPTLGALNMPKAAGGKNTMTPGMDQEGRRYDLNVVVVNFANIGATYASKVLKKDKTRGDRLFCWEGVRKAVKHVTQDLGLEAVGCVFENYKGPDNGGIQVPIPQDIRQMCKSIQETPSLTGKNQKSADDEMTIKCAYRRNCRFMDNDNYRDWLREMRKPEIRTWLESCQEMLQMRYFFDNDLGTFDTLDGNVPVGLLDPNNAAARTMRR